MDQKILKFDLRVPENRLEGILKLVKKKFQGWDLSHVLLNLVEK
jgi:hypothetical protein